MVGIYYADTIRKMEFNDVITAPCRQLHDIAAVNYYKSPDSRIYSMITVKLPMSLTCLLGYKLCIR